MWLVRTGSRFHWCVAEQLATPSESFPSRGVFSVAGGIEAMWPPFGIGLWDEQLRASVGGFYLQDQIKVGAASDSVVS